MKRICLIILFLFAVIFTGTFSFAETVTTMAMGTLDVGEVFSLEFFEDSNVSYTTSIPFSQMDPTETFVQSDGKILTGNMDIGLVCKTNLSKTWYLKIAGTSGSLIDVGEMKYGLWQPFNLTRNEYADGVVSGGEGWHFLSTVPTTVYTSGLNDKSNLSKGTLIKLKFGINPSKIDSTVKHSCSIQYILTATP